MSTTEAALIERVHAGDEPAASALLRRYQGEVYGYLFHLLGQREDAEDAAQETFLNALRALPRYEERGRFKSWLFRIAHREALRVIRARASRPSRFSAAHPTGAGAAPHPEMPDPDALHPADTLAAGERIAHLRSLIGQLPATEREVVLLRTRAGLTFREIAALLDCPLNTALGRMRNATQRLRRSCQHTVR